MAGYSRMAGLVRTDDLAAAMSLPQDMMLPGSPMPRKDSVASATMKTPSSMVARTMIGASAFGRTCRTSEPNRETPSERAAVTKSALRTSITAPRVMRAICGQPSATRIRTTVQTPRFSRKNGSCDDHQCAQDQREGEEDVAETGHHGVDPAAVEAGEGAEGDPDDQRRKARRRRPPSATPGCRG